MKTLRFGLLSPVVCIVFLVTLFSVHPAYSSQTETASSGTESGQPASDSNPSSEITLAKDESASNSTEGADQETAENGEAKGDVPPETEPEEADKEGESMALLSGGAASESGDTPSAPESKLFTGSLTYTIPIKVPPAIWLSGRVF